MRIQLFRQLEEAIERTIEANADKDYWQQYAYDDLIKDMTKAAALVFDACMQGQDFAERERGGK